MIDAAVPMEAVQGNMSYNPDMIYSTWRHIPIVFSPAIGGSYFTNSYPQHLDLEQSLGQPRQRGYLQLLFQRGRSLAVGPR